MSNLPLMYLDSPNPDLWNYQDRGDVFVWSDTGETIMLSANAAALCKVLLSQLNGLPSLTAILCISDALSKGWDTSTASRRVGLLIRSIQERKRPVDLRSYSHTIDWLESLGQLSSDLRKGINAQCAFLGEIWEKFPRSWLEIDSQESQVAIAWLSLAAMERPDNEFSSVDVSSYRSKNALQSLEFASLLTIDEKAIRNRLKTGIDIAADLPTSPEPIELKHPIRQILNQLFEENNFGDQGMVASLAWELSSLISLPRKPSEPDALPIGGVSDISNRGDPERLLMTELAADPDLLIARIAHGQALYIRRESPPKPRPKTRDIWIENSIRCWGEPRLTMFAFALAAAVAEEQLGTDIHITTLAGDAFFAEDFSTLDGLTTALERLDDAQHPGEAIQFLTQKHEQEKDPLIEPLIIITSATANDPTFLEKAQSLPVPHLRAVIEPDRWVVIWEQTSRGGSVWKKLQLKPALRSKNSSRRAELPLFVKQTCSPLRFISDLNVPFVQAFENGKQPGAWLITKQGRLLYFDIFSVGGIDLGSLPNCKVLASVTPSKNCLMLVIETNAQTESEEIHYLVKATLTEGIKLQRIEPPSIFHSSLKYYFDQGLLWRLGHQLEVIDSNRGNVLAACKVSQRHLGGPFYGDRSLSLATYENQKIKWLLVGRCSSTIGFAVRTTAGPLAVASDLSWTICFNGSNEPERVTGRKVISTMHPDLVRINYDQTEALFTIEKITKVIGFEPLGTVATHLAFNISFNKRTLSPVRLPVVNALRAFERTNLQLPISHSVSSRFNFTGVHPEGLLLARNRNKVLLLRSTREQFNLTECKEPGLGETLIPFSDGLPQIQEMHRRKWKLTRAEIGRCTIWLDSRGLLHLRDADGIELSFMLAQSSLAGWFSPGEVFGPLYFTGKTHAQASQAVCDWYMRFIQQCYT